MDPYRVEFVSAKMTCLRLIRHLLPCCTFSDSVTDEGKVSPNVGWLDKDKTATGKPIAALCLSCF